MDKEIVLFVNWLFRKYPELALVAVGIIGCVMILSLGALVN